MVPASKPTFWLSALLDGSFSVSCTRLLWSGEQTSDAREHVDLRDCEQSRTEPKPNENYLRPRVVWEKELRSVMRYRV